MLKIEVWLLRDDGPPLTEPVEVARLVTPPRVGECVTLKSGQHVRVVDVDWHLPALVKISVRE